MAEKVWSTQERPNENIGGNGISLERHIHILYFTNYQQVKAIIEEEKGKGELRTKTLQSRTLLGVRLYYWLYDQRKKYENGSMDPKRKDLLDSLGMEWSLPDEK
jgi:Helicase associated domain